MDGFFLVLATLYWTTQVPNHWTIHLSTDQPTMTWFATEFRSISISEVIDFWWFLGPKILTITNPHTTQNGNPKTGRFFHILSKHELGTHWAPWSCHYFCLVYSKWYLNTHEGLAIQEMYVVTKGKNTIQEPCSPYLINKNTANAATKQTLARCVIYLSQPMQSPPLPTKTHNIHKYIYMHVYIHVIT